jgi:hypothetical protein
MGRPRAELQTKFEAITPNVYFQPPSNLQMKYPCIRYVRNNRATRFANDKPYAHTKGYQVTILDRDPDSVLPEMVADLPMCRFERHYKADDLNHDVYTIFF